MNRNGNNRKSLENASPDRENKPWWLKDKSAHHDQSRVKKVTGKGEKGTRVYNMKGNGFLVGGARRVNQTHRFSNSKNRKGRRKMGN